MSFVKGLFTGLVGTSVFEAILYSVPYLRTNFWDNPKLIYGHHFHHSILGLLFILFGLFYFKKKLHRGLFLIGLGFGIIIIHTVSDGRLIFIE